MMNRNINGQRLITGRAPETYDWKDGRPRSARPAHANRSHSNTGTVQKENTAEKLAKEIKQHKEAVISKALMYFTVIFVVFILFLQIGKLSEISGKRTDIDGIKHTNTDLLVSIENLEVEYGIETDEKVIKQKAEDKLRMRMPTESNVFVLRDVSRGEQVQYLTAGIDAFNR